MDSYTIHDWIIQNNIQQFTNVIDLDVWATANHLEADESVNLRRLELMCEAINRPQTTPQPVESVIIIESKECTDWFQEMQNQPEPELTPSQNVALTFKFDIFQPQTSQQLHTQRVNKSTEMQMKTTQSEEMILQQEINVKIAEKKTNLQHLF